MKPILAFIAFVALTTVLIVAQPSATPNQTNAHGNTLPGTPCETGTFFHKSDWTLSGKVYVCTGNTWLQIAGGNGNPMSGTTSAIGGTLLSGGACTSPVTVTITGATTAMAVEATPSADPGDGSYTKKYVSAPDTVSVQVCEAVGSTPNSVTYNVRVIP